MYIQGKAPEGTGLDKLWKDKEEIRKRSDQRQQAKRSGHGNHQREKIKPLRVSDRRSDSH
jgi:hypothetical protein